MHGYNDGLSTPNDTSLSSLGHGGPPTGPCTPMSYLGENLVSNLTFFLNLIFEFKLDYNLKLIAFFF